MSKGRPQCGLILENAEGRVVVQLRDYKPDLPYSGCIGTFGGQIEEGESRRQAIEREIQDELGYKLADYEYIGNFPFDGYDIHMFRKVDTALSLNALTISEGEAALLLSVEDVESGAYQWAFNCRDILLEYFRRYHQEFRNDIGQ